MKQVKLFVPVYMACGFSEFDGLDYMLASKILRKFESLNLTFLKKEFKVSKAYIEELKKLG